MSAQEIRKLGMPMLKEEGTYKDLDTGEEATPEQIAAYKKGFAIKLDLERKIERNLKQLSDLKQIYGVVTPEWIEQQLELAKGLNDERGQGKVADYLRELVIMRMGTGGQIADPHLCAKLLVPERLYLPFGLMDFDDDE